MNRVCHTAAALLAITLWAGSAGAQTVRLEGAATDSASRVIQNVLARGDYLLLDRDTVLGADWALDRDLVVTRAAVRLEGRIDGAVVVLDGDFFVRPGAVITGPIAVAGGGAYPSGLAEMGPILETAPRVAVVVEPVEAGYAVRLVQPPPPARIRPTGGPFGVAIPTYDRVDGLTIGWGSRLMLIRAEDAPFLHAGVTFATERGRIGGSAGVEFPLGDGWAAAAGARRETLTNEGWIRGDLANSLAALTVGSDPRDYHESDQVHAGLYRRPTQPLIQGESFFGPRLVVTASRDRSLDAGDPWSLFGGDWRENPPIDDGTIVSVLGGLAFAWRGATSTLDGDAAVEWAPGGIGDHELAQFVGEGDWTMRALWGHHIAVYGRGMFGLSGDPLPRQRWSFVGGTGTLPTLETAQHRGDNLVFVRSDYTVPVPPLRIRYLGEPSLRVSHVVGSAWVSGQPMPGWDQNLGAGVGLALASAMLWIDPSDDSLDPTLAFSLSLGL